MEDRHLLLISIIIGLFTLNIISMLFFTTVAIYDPSRPDIIGTILSYFSDFSKLTVLWNDLLFGQGLQGSAIWVKYALFLFLIPPLYALDRYVLQRFLGDRHKVFHTNWFMITLMTIWTFIALTINGIAQAEDWYFINIQCNVCGNIIRIPGTFDFATHFNIIGVFAGWLVQLDFMKHFKLKGKKGQLAKTIIVYFIVMIIAISWEIIEAFNTERFGQAYTNAFGNSLSDLVASAFAILMITWIYYWIAYDKLIYINPIDKLREIIKK